MIVEELVNRVSFKVGNLAELKRDPHLQVLDFPFAEGVTLVRKTG